MESYYRNDAARHRNGGQQASECAGSGRSSSGRSEQKLEQIGKVMVEELQVGTHTYRLKPYHQCFVGTDAVKFLIKKNFATDARDAVRLGNQLMERGLFRHVLQQHIFRVCSVYCFQTSHHYIHHHTTTTTTYKE